MYIYIYVTHSIVNNDSNYILLYIYNIWLVKLLLPPIREW